ncbi:FKBP-type peptidyl-prolyl cis-trans isomerase [Escherichia albertii]|uniref:FKBP-type peptidyl-prolyl cis-trans isomerase n=1 Tax=Escherichia albertii TaxID=208962 RepID=UPI001A13C224|nr:FKBP-type peptidyl-prolyl cis-trans isomerase [Escherichia albertii]MCU7297432.1 FKBP-type peptidyl-prolyl cis-trans isomerase [Escherichia albertii]MCU7306749.1 FKBP-type peptidyl-prolyl cis-trans isomerase [Escherichia albertii]MCZ8925791.1 FKBP-type peptidyl-prolyl cis-trans isomerase [Escherichia albertii]MCZ9155111.1 FKBP-type peptidyl-prolyl cis-trans isomerase [Escherichia albertii]MCZ9164507.1 FKBP-type peptidyl-prolyl cis-trans isomerase [Escherichia albertii]
MNDRLKICRRILQTTGGVALLLWGGCAGAGDNSGGVPGILKFAQQYQQQEASAIKEGGTGEKTDSVARSVGKGEAGAGSNTELRRRLTQREQEVRQLKKENRGLRERLKVLPDTAQDNAEKDKVVASLKAELDESRKQLETITRKGEQAQETLNAQVIELKQQLSRMETESKAAAEQAGKEKTELQATLNTLKAEMADMPVVTAEMLKPDDMQQTYAAGVMLGRDMLNLQAAQQQLGLKTDNRILMAGIRDALNRKVLLNESVLDVALQRAEELAQKARLAVIREQKKVGAAWLEKFRKQKGVKQAEGGFWYRSEYAGDGEFIRGDDTLVDVVVTEKLTDGTVVEDMDARGRVISQVLGEYPPVFREALMLMKNHGTMELVVPPELAYGDEGYPPKVPPGATMVYTLRVEEVKPVAEPSSGESTGKNMSSLAGKNDKAGRTEGVKK